MRINEVLDYCLFPKIERSVPLVSSNVHVRSNNDHLSCPPETLSRWWFVGVIDRVVTLQQSYDDTELLSNEDEKKKPCKWDYH